MYCISCQHTLDARNEIGVRRPLGMFLKWSHPCQSRRQQYDRWGQMPPTGNSVVSQPASVNGGGGGGVRGENIMKLIHQTCRMTLAVLSKDCNPNMTLWQACLSQPSLYTHCNFHEDFYRIRLSRVLIITTVIFMDSSPPPQCYQVQWVLKYRIAICESVRWLFHAIFSGWGNEDKRFQFVIWLEGSTCILMVQW